jgi:hypothetical protein
LRKQKESRWKTHNKYILILWIILNSCIIIAHNNS